jgi:hypothetical protein
MLDEVASWLSRTYSGTDLFLTAYDWIAEVGDPYLKGRSVHVRASRIFYSLALAKSDAKAVRRVLARPQIGVVGQDKFWTLPPDLFFCDALAGDSVVTVRVSRPESR